MTVEEAIRKRYSCRSYIDKRIEPEKMEKILEAARFAPSAKNLQDWRFVVATDDKTRFSLAEAANGQMFLAEAAAIIVACSNNDHVMRCGERIGPIDVAIALEHIALQAVELGLATCWIGSFFPDKVRAILGIPEEIEIVELMPLGYPADKARPPKRMAVEKIACYENWQF